MSPHYTTPIKNTHLFFDEDGNEVNRCTLVFDTEQDMIRFNLPDEELEENEEENEDEDEDDDDEDDNEMYFSKEECESGMIMIREENINLTDPPHIGIPKINYRFLIKHPLVLLKFRQFIFEYNYTVALEFSTEAKENGSEVFSIPPMPSYIAEHILNHYQHRFPQHTHRNCLRYSSEDEEQLCDYVKALTYTSADSVSSNNTWEIKDEGLDLDAWNPVYMPLVNFKFIAYHPRVLVAYFHFINTYNSFHHPIDEYKTKFMSREIINIIREHDDIKHNNNYNFVEKNDINFLMGILERFDKENQDTECYCEDECDPVQAAYNKYWLNSA